MPLTDDPAPTAAPARQSMASPFEDLRSAVLRELREGTGDPGLELDEGDTVDVRIGDLQLFVWVRAKPRSVRVWCGVAKPIDVTPAVHALMNETNNYLSFARIYSYRDAVFLSVDVQGEPFCAEHLRSAIIGIASLAPELRKRFRQQAPAPPEA